MPADDPWKSPKGDDPWKSPKGDDPWKSPKGDDRVVVDSTVFAAIALREPGFERMAGRLAAMRRVRTAPFFRFEVGNALWKTRSIAEDDALLAMVMIFRMPVDDRFDIETARTAFRLARGRRLAFYDAAFVALAQAEGLPLWTLDRAQASAARAESVELLP